MDGENFMENPIKHGMIWGVFPLFLETPRYYFLLTSGFFYEHFPEKNEAFRAFSGWKMDPSRSHQLVSLPLKREAFRTPNRKGVI